MTVVGVVREWHQDEGWGVIDSDETPGGCWAHFSSAAVPGYATFTAGQAIWLEWESPGQDGYPFRAARFWPYEADATGTVVGREPGDAYRSELSLSFDERETGSQ
jgi:cold shock protein